MRFWLIASVFVLSGCSWFGGDKPASEMPQSQAAPSSGQKVTITKATWAAFENYKFWLTPIAWNRPMGQGYFAVSEDGRSWGLTGCPVNNCVAGSPVSQDAINVCESRSGGVGCAVFAKDQTVIVPYAILE